MEVRNIIVEHELNRIIDDQIARIAYDQTAGEAIEALDAQWGIGQVEVPIPIIDGGVSFIIDEELSDEAYESLLVNKKPEFNKAKFLSTIHLTDELKAILEPLETKEAILKAVFEHSQGAKPITYPLNKKYLAFAHQYNGKIEKNYTSRLESFYNETIEAFNAGNVGAYVSDREGTIKKPAIIPTDIFTHPLFRIVALKEVDIRGFRDSLSLTFETREPVKFTYMGKTINAGAFRFRLYFNLDKYGRSKLRFCKMNCNFSRNAGPYIFDSGAVCTGDSSHSLREKIRAGDLYGYMTEVYTVMTRYNPESHPVRGLDRMVEDAINGNLYRRDGTKVLIENTTKTEEFPF